MILLICESGNMFRKFLVVLVCIVSLNTAFSQESDVNSLILAGNYNLAIQKVNNILIDHPQNMTARFQYATILSLTQKTDSAIEEYNKLLKDYPALFEVQNNLGVLYAQQGLYEKAANAFQEAVNINPKYNTALENLGDLYIKMAAQSYKRVLSNDLNNESSMMKYIKTKSLSIDLNLANFQKTIKN